jgi:hypothetical protein
VIPFWPLNLTSAWLMPMRMLVEHSSSPYFFPPFLPTVFSTGRPVLVVPRKTTPGLLSVRCCRSRAVSLPGFLPFRRQSRNRRSVLPPICPPSLVDAVIEAHSHREGKQYFLKMFYPF